MNKLATVYFDPSLTPEELEYLLKEGAVSSQLARHSKRLKRLKKLMAPGAENAGDIFQDLGVATRKSKHTAANIAREAKKVDVPLQKVKSRQAIEARNLRKVKKAKGKARSVPGSSPSKMKKRLTATQAHTVQAKKPKLKVKPKKDRSFGVATGLGALGAGLGGLALATKKQPKGLSKNKKLLSIAGLGAGALGLGAAGGSITRQKASSAHQGENHMNKLATRNGFNKLATSGMDKEAGLGDILRRAGKSVGNANRGAFDAIGQAGKNMMGSRLGKAHSGAYEVIMEALGKAGRGAGKAGRGIVDSNMRVGKGIVDANVNTYKALARKLGISKSPSGLKSYMTPKNLAIGGGALGGGAVGVGLARKESMAKNAFWPKEMFGAGNKVLRGTDRAVGGGFKGLGNLFEAATSGSTYRKMGRGIKNKAEGARYVISGDKARDIAKAKELLRNKALMIGGGSIGAGSILHGLLTRNND